MLFKDPSLTGKRVLVTAGANGIGLEITKGFVQAGAKVMICDVSQDAIDQAKSALPGIHAILADVAARLHDPARPIPYHRFDNGRHRLLTL